MWTLYDVMVAAAAAEPPISVVVFDRPNPLGGEVVEGPVSVDPACASFVGRRPIAVRHGMTVGELAWLFNKCFVPKDPDNPSKRAVVGHRTSAQVSTFHQFCTQYLKAILVSKNTCTLYVGIKLGSSSGKPVSNLFCCEDAMCSPTPGSWRWCP